MNTTPQTQRIRPAPRNTSAVAISLCAPTAADLEQAMRFMRVRAGFFVSFASPHVGRHGAWVVNGTLFVPGSATS